MEMMDIVNEKDEVVGKAQREEVYKKLLLHRIVHVLIFNVKGEMALQLRSNVNFCPYYWCTAAGGHVKSGESWEDAGKRELKEELGVEAKLTLLYKDIYTDNFRKTNMKKILATFKTVYSGSFKINPEEVDKIEFFSLEKIQQMVNNKEKMHPELLFLLKKHFGVK
ncbi:MAG: NUDIX domain-containing protein [Candidatus Aenigmarchaeota archaeon]|nr:NUDIX domain-containing protein [Candidatus Aenigmarchaeota archaeon]